MDAAFVSRNRIALTLAGAQAMLAAAVAKAGEIAVDQCIAVVDSGGALLAFARMDRAKIGSVEIALTKATSAAIRRRPTGEEGGGDVLPTIRLALAAKNRVTGLAGGFPIEIDGQVVGGIGVSSGSTDEDITVAKAGLAVLG